MTGTQLWNSRVRDEELLLFVAGIIIITLVILPDLVYFKSSFFYAFARRKVV